MKLEKFVKKSISNVPLYVSGKTIEEIASIYGIEVDNIIRLASNENPLGPSPAALEAAEEALKVSHLYPDPEAKDLCSALKEYMNINSEIVVGNGSDDVLEQIVKIFVEYGNSALIAVPTFSYYSILVKMYGGIPYNIPLKKGKNSFSFDVNSILNSVESKTKLIFICSPNNPTGNSISESELEEILETEKVVVLDEAYKEFSESSMAELTETYSNLVVTGTFSKAFGLAGLRAGYCACNTALKELILKVKQPFNVSFVAQNAALAALKDVEHLERSVKLARNGRECIIKRARGLGLKAYDSQGNFVLIKVEGKPEIVEDLFRKGIIVRGCGSFPGLSEEYFRVSVGLENENKMFVDSLREIV